MASLNFLDITIETDVLVVGGGLSGLWAANRARDFVDTVIIVDKGPGMGYAGEGYFSGGNLQALPPEENVDDYVKDIISLGDELYEQDLIEKILMESWERLQDFRRMGVEFEEDNGKLKYVPQRGLQHNACFIGKPSGRGGQNMMSGLSREAKKLGVKYLNRTYIVDLLKHDGRVVGAVGFNIRSGQFYIFKAGAVILATGGCSFRGGYEDTHMSYGEGIELAFNAGAELKNLEFVTMWIIPQKFRWEGVTFLLPLGAVFLNRHNEQFMNKYAPVLKSNCDYNFIARAMAMEAREGRQPFYLDCSGMRQEDKILMTPAEGWTKLQYEQLLAAGIRPFEEKQEWTATPWTNNYVHSDLEMRTVVPGLFVAGTLRNFDPGIYFGGWSICKTAAFGRWAGESAGKYARENPKTVTLDQTEITRLKQSTFGSLHKNPGFSAEEVLIELQKTIFPVFVLKNEKNLKAALQKVVEIRQEKIPRIAAPDLHLLAKGRSVASMGLVAELVLRASLMRTESRASHYREDYPKRDNDKWLGWLIFRNIEENVTHRFEPIHKEKYKHQAWQYYSDNFQFPR